MLKTSGLPIIRVNDVSFFQASYYLKFNSKSNENQINWIHILIKVFSIFFLFTDLIAVAKGNLAKELRYKQPNKASQISS